MNAPVIYREQIEQDPNTPFPLGRHIEHDERSRAYGFVPMLGGVDKSTWHDVTHRLYNPRPTPNQTKGNCTMCAEAMLMNSAGNRVKGDKILNMDWAMTGYEYETAHDEFPGQYPPDDTGSSGLAAAKTAQHFGIGGEYNFNFSGVDALIQGLMEGKSFSVGTRWDHGMFTPDVNGVIKPGGPSAGGHQWFARRYRLRKNLVGVDCWWGGWKAWIEAPALDELLQDRGDVYTQVRLHQ